MKRTLYFGFGVGETGGAVVVVSGKEENHKANRPAVAVTLNVIFIAAIYTSFATL